MEQMSRSQPSPVPFQADNEKMNALTNTKVMSAQDGREMAREPAKASR